MLDKYINLFAHLRTDSGTRWPDSTHHRAPYKPLLLLSVLDLFARGSLTANLITPDPELGELFAGYWAKVMPPDREGDVSYPFFHLKTSGFWQLVAQPGQETGLESGTPIRYITQLRRIIQGARLNDDLFANLCTEDSREVLRSVLVETYFVPDLHAALYEQGNINLLAYRYSEKLLIQAREQPKVLVELEGVQPPLVEPVRSQGFRRAVITAYTHRCALCGVRILTTSGHTAVDASHIIPWSETHNDDPRNGLALCGLCHWTFDEGLAAISDQYLVLLASQLKADSNIPGHLLTLEGRSILGPSEDALWPDQEAIRWHRARIFEKY